MENKNKKIPWWESQIGSPLERELIEQVLVDNYANEGKLTARFETEIASSSWCEVCRGHDEWH